MQKKFLLLALALMMAGHLQVKAQDQDSTYKKRKLSTTDVQIVMSYYTQDNDHSAVTGGKGTEETGRPVDPL